MTDTGSPLGRSARLFELKGASTTCEPSEHQTRSPAERCAGLSYCRPGLALNPPESRLRAGPAGTASPLRFRLVSRNAPSTSGNASPDTFYLLLVKNVSYQMPETIARHARRRRVRTRPAPAALPIRPEPDSYAPPCEHILPRHAPVAQLDRAPDYESGGRRFESFRARQLT